MKKLILFVSVILIVIPGFAGDGGNGIDTFDAEVSPVTTISNEIALSENVSDETSVSENSSDEESESVQNPVPVTYDYADFETIGLEEDIQTEISVRTKLITDPGVNIAKVEAGLTMLLDDLQEIEYDDETGEWTGTIILPSERLESGNYLLKATLATNANSLKAVSYSTNFPVYPEYNINARRSTRWRLVLDFIYIGLFLAIASILKRKVKFFQKFLVPNSIIAGFIGLLLGPNVLGIFEFAPERLGDIVYHLMAIGFISIALQSDNNEKKYEGQPVSTGAFIVSNYAVQGIVGLLITVPLALFIFKDLFPPMGVLLPLGYGQGPGTAYAFGSGWEKLGFLYGGNIGITIATFGFLWACFAGVPLMNLLIKRKGFKPASSLYGKTDKETRKITEDLYRESADNVPLSESIDRFTIQVFLIAIAYFASFGTIWGIEEILLAVAKKSPGFYGTAQVLSGMFWGMHFIFGSIYAIILRKFLKLFKKLGWMSREYPNDFILQRIGGGSFDIMIAASITAISIPVFIDYAVPILLLTTVGGIATMLFIIFLAKKVYKKYTLEYILTLFGMATGTVSTGLALLKEVDPTFETPAAKDMVFGSGTALAFGLPVIMSISIPINGFVKNNPSLYWLEIVILAVMLGALFLVIFIAQRARLKTLAEAPAVSGEGESVDKKKKKSKKAGKNDL